MNAAMSDYARRMRTIRAEFAKGRGYAKRAARELGISADSVRKYAHKYGVAKCRSK